VTGHDPVTTCRKPRLPGQPARLTGEPVYGVADELEPIASDD
jgi:hypothetical protein